MGHKRTIRRNSCDLVTITDNAQRTFRQHSQHTPSYMRLVQVSKRLHGIAHCCTMNYISCTICPLYPWYLTLRVVVILKKAPLVAQTATTAPRGIPRTPLGSRGFGPRLSPGDLLQSGAAVRTPRNNIWAGGRGSSILLAWRSLSSASYLLQKSPFRSKKHK